MSVKSNVRQEDACDFIKREAPKAFKPMRAYRRIAPAGSRWPRCAIISVGKGSPEANRRHASAGIAVADSPAILATCSSLTR